MNRAERRRHQSRMRKLPKPLTKVPEYEWPKGATSRVRIDVWRNHKFLVQAFEEPDGVVRLSISSTSVTANGRWKDGITWEELQSIKNDVGYGDRHAVEIFPSKDDLVNVANMRHLWVLKEPLPFAWRNG